MHIWTDHSPIYCDLFFRNDFSSFDGFIKTNFEPTRTASTVKARQFGMHGQDGSVQNAERDAGALVFTR